MVDENSLGALGPNILSVESGSDTEFSVQGSNFVTGFTVIVQDGVDQVVEGISLSQLTATAFTLTLPYATPGTCTLTVTNPDRRTSTQRFATPGTQDSNEKLRADS